jgi:hypothetical protein
MALLPTTVSGLPITSHPSAGRTDADTGSIQVLGWLALLAGGPLLVALVATSQGKPSWMSLTVWGKLPAKTRRQYADGSKLPAAQPKRSSVNKSSQGKLKATVDASLRQSSMEGGTERSLSCQTGTGPPDVGQVLDDLAALCRYEFSPSSVEAAAIAAAGLPPHTVLYRDTTVHSCYVGVEKPSGKLYYAMLNGRNMGGFPTAVEAAAHWAAHADEASLQAAQRRVARVAPAEAVLRIADDHGITLKQSNSESGFVGVCEQKQNGTGQFLAKIHRDGKQRKYLACGPPLRRPRYTVLSY